MTAIKDLQTLIVAYVLQSPPLVLITVLKVDVFYLFEPKNNLIIFLITRYMLSISQNNVIMGYAC